MSASTIANTPSVWNDMLADMAEAGQEYLFSDTTASAALWSSPCMEFWNGMSKTGPPLPVFSILAADLKDIMKKVGG